MNRSNIQNNSLEELGVVLTDEEMGIVSLQTQHELQPPSGWMTVEDAIERSGIDPLDFSVAIKHLPGTGSNSRWKIWISEDWIEHHCQVRGLATEHIFKRYVADISFLNAKPIELQIDEYCRSHSVAATRRQYNALKLLMKRSFLRRYEKQFIAQLIKDKIATKRDLAALLDYFKGRTTWNGSKHERIGKGELQLRQEERHQQRQSDSRLERLRLAQLRRNPVIAGVAQQ